MVGIYKITSPSGKVYIGQSWNIGKRKNIYAKCLCNQQIRLYNSIRKHGWEKHIIEVIHELPSNTNQKTMDDLEVHYWRESILNGYTMLNIREPGKGGRLSEESKRKIGEKNRVNGLGRKRSKDAIYKMLDTMRKNGTLGGGSYPRPSKKKGIKVNPESIAKQIQTKINNGTTGKGRKHSTETIEKRIATLKRNNSSTKGRPAWNKGVPCSEENKIRISNKLKGNIPWNKGLPSSSAHKESLKKAWERRRANHVA